MVRTVHWLQKEFFIRFRGMDGLETVLPVLLIVARGYIKFLLPDMGGNNHFVTGFFLRLFQELFEPLAEGGAFGQPERQPLANLLGKGKQSQFLPQLPMVPFFGFLQQVEVFR